MVIALDLAHFNERHLRRFIVIRNQVGAGQIQLLGLVLHDLSKGRDQLRQLDRFTNFILCHTEKLSYDTAGGILLARFARS